MGSLSLDSFCCLPTQLPGPIFHTKLSLFLYLFSLILMPSSQILHQERGGWNRRKQQQQQTNTQQLENLPSRDDKKACSIVNFFINQCSAFSLHKVIILNYCGQECALFPLGNQET